ncbi:26962_t:CDS:2, partial [Racocetra persica]
DLLSIGEGNRNFQEDGRVHWNKFALMGDVLNMIRKFQKSSYNIKSNILIEKFIADTVIMNDDELYKKSLELEPRIQRAASESRQILQVVYVYGFYAKTKDILLASKNSVFCLL